MRFSLSLRKNIMETGVGKLLNRFKIKSRRDVLFFEGILAEYIKECENNGYKREMAEIGQKWCALTLKQVVPESFRKLPLSLLFSIFKKIWINLGMMDDIKIAKNKDVIQIETLNERSTGAIGKNYFSQGLFIGILNVIFESEIECIDYLQTKKKCIYTFRIKDEPFSIDSKEKKLYDRLNSFQEFKGVDFKSALQKNMFQLKDDNKIYFRGRVLYAVENTLFHLFGIYNIRLQTVPKISYLFFNKIIEKSASKEKKLYLIKTILESTGCGIVKITFNKKKIVFEIKNPPYGLQKEDDNWNFLAKTILGFLWLINKGFKISNIKTDYQELIIVYSR